VLVTAEIAGATLTCKFSHRFQTFSSSNADEIPKLLQRSLAEECRFFC